MVADDPDVEKQQQRPLPTTKADELPSGWWWPKASSWPAPLLLVTGLGCGIGLVVVPRGGYLLYALFALQALPSFVVMSLIAWSLLPDPDEQIQAAGFCWWSHEYHKAMACSWPAAVALVVVLEAGITRLVLWEDLLGDYVVFVFLLLGFFLQIMFGLVMLVLPDPGDQDGGAPGRWLRLVWEAFVFVGVLWSIAMIILLTLVMCLAVAFMLVESWRLGQ